MKNILSRINGFLQPVDSLLLGILFILPVGITLWFLGFVDAIATGLWKGMFNISGTEGYFFVPGTALAMSGLCIYGIGRISKSHWFMKSVGKILVKIPIFGGLYKKAIWITYTRKGFLKPVWVFRNGLLEFDKPGPDGKIIRVLLGNRRRGFFLREVYDDNPELPQALRLTCEITLPPAQVVGGEPETFPFKLVAVQLAPSTATFSESIVTQGLSGYNLMSTKFWDEVRKTLNFKELPEKDRELLKGIGIIIEKDAAIIDV